MPNITPKPRLMAMGIRNWACTLRSSSMGVRPAKVVREVSKMGRKRRRPASVTASRVLLPWLRIVLAVKTRTRESLTTTPDRPTIPKRLNRLMSNPMIR